MRDARDDEEGEADRRHVEVAVLDEEIVGQVAGVEQEQEGEPAQGEEHPAHVAAPLILERMGEFEMVHFDDRLGLVEEVTTGESGVQIAVSRVGPGRVLTVVGTTA